MSKVKIEYIVSEDNEGNHVVNISDDVTKLTRAGKAQRL